MTHRQASTAQAKAPAAPLPLFWGQAWPSAPEGVNQRLQQLQDDAKAVQEAMHDASIGQWKDMVQAVQTITRVLDDAARAGGFDAVLRVQPDILHCWLEVSQAGQQRLFDVARVFSDRALNGVGLGVSRETPPAAAEQGE